MNIDELQNEKDMELFYSSFPEKRKENYQLFESKQSLIDRAVILESGTLTSDNKFWFNEKWAKVFMTKVASAESVGFTYVKWKNAKREIVEVPLDQAKVYIKEMIAVLDKIYLG